MLKSSGKLKAALFVALAILLGFLPPAYSSPTENSDTVACKANKAMSQKTLGKFYAHVINIDTKKVLLDVRGLELTAPASVIKVLTAASAITTLPEDYRASTQLLSFPEEPSTLIFRGGGDFTLSRLVPGQSSVYTKPARISNLVEQALENLPTEVPITRIILDTSFFDGESWNQDWPDSYRSLGYVSHITALQTDGDRVQPNRLASNYNFRRTTDPVIAAGKALRKQLGDLARGAELVLGVTPESATVIAEVTSQDLRENWIRHMLVYSDNTSAEFIARHAARFSGLDPSITGSQKVIKDSLRALGMKPKRLVIRDASGLSSENRVHARAMARMMVKIANNENGLGVISDWLPIAGETGTLKYRFQGKAAIARGQVIGKTGYIPGLYGLSGIITAKDGTRLAFAVFASKDEETGATVTTTAQPAIDRVIARFYSCGASLSQ